LSGAEIGSVISLCHWNSVQPQGTASMHLPISVAGSGLIPIRGVLRGDSRRERPAACLQRSLSSVPLPGRVLRGCGAVEGWASRPLVPSAKTRSAMAVAAVLPLGLDQLGHESVNTALCR
jgi:hypothetical protein